MSSATYRGVQHHERRLHRGRSAKAALPLLPPSRHRRRLMLSAPHARAQPDAAGASLPLSPVQPMSKKRSASSRHARARGLSVQTSGAPRSAPGEKLQQQRRHRHGGRNVVAWVPDSLAEKCYHCQAYFSLVLRRHHCRRCGNVFCDACSSARMPLVGSGFFAPVRVCGKCCVAAKKAHAKMVQERQARHYQPRRHSDSGERERDSRGFFSSTDGTRYRHLHQPQTQQWGTQSHVLSTADGAQANGLNESFPSDGSRAFGDFALSGEPSDLLTSNGPRRRPSSSGFDHSSSLLYEERERAGSEDAASGGDYFLQTLTGEAVLVRNDNVRVRFLDRIEHTGTLFVTNYRLVFSPSSASVADGDVVDSRPSMDLSINLKHSVREDELPYASDLCTEAVAAYQAIPLVSIERVKRKEMVETDSGLLEVVGKDFRRVQFLFDGLVSKQTFSLFDRTFSLVRMHALGEPEGKVDEFAKFSLERFDGVDGAVDGWGLYDSVAEFQRMGISSSSSRWRLSQSNDKYELCPTYPSVLAVPTSVSDSVLLVASKFRSKGRIPVLSWRDRHTGSVICRSSQPLVGLGQKQCDKDVFLIQAIAATNPSSSKLVIIDARPWKNAVAQKTVGRAGYELTEHYETRHATASLKYADMVASERTAAAEAAAAAAAAARSVSSMASTSTAGTAGVSINGEALLPDNSANGVDQEEDEGRRQLVETMESSLVLTECKLIFMGIENIHTMRKSYHKLMDLCTTKQSNDKWLDQLASTHWLDHISRILDSAVEIVRIVKEQKSSVLVHCSDGWDRTAQLTALAELLIDPYYRTIHGFEVLIEKEWCSFGHKFRDRTGHGSSNGSSETSPVFLQWIDCVWQVLTQFPSAFEFNERYLMLILDHLYSCRFGTFLYDCQRERVEQEALHPTQSLWSFLNTVDRAVIANPFYQPQDAPRMKWKASVTATRQCFERSLADKSDEEIPMIPLMTHDDCEVHSLVDEFQDYKKARGVFVQSNGSSPCSSPSSMTYGSTIAVASSPSHSRDGAGDTKVTDALQSTHAQLMRELQRHRDDNYDSPLGYTDIGSSDDDDEFDMLQQPPSCFHKLVRDLDSGFSFPQPLEASALANFPMSPPAPPRSRSLHLVRRTAEDEPASAARTSTPKSRSSLTSLFMSSVERPPLSSDSLWNASDGDVVSEGDETSRYGALASFEDVLVPSCAMKALGFWSHYYLRWDPTSHFDRDSSVEIETLHRDLLMRLETLTDRVATIQEVEAVRWERKFQRFLYGSRQDRTLDGTTGSLSPLNKSRRPATRAISDGSTSSQDSAVSTGSAGELFGQAEAARGSSKTLEEQIKLLQEQKRRSLEEVEAKFQEELARLMSGDLPSSSGGGMSSDGIRLAR
ncbi:hypothetical protein BBJ28_00009341 [Nothophytophthora sp. Chile5]|nr:hypothetical protein BBJ28_00009341 [Nothophytophthora sp. Chile5]